MADRDARPTRRARLQVRLALLIGGIAGIVLAVRAARRCRSSFEGWLLLAAGCNGLGAAVVRWNPQWHVALVLPVLALLVLGDPPAWSRRDQAALALLGALCLPDAMTSAAFYRGLPGAVTPLALSATVPGRLGGRSLAAGGGPAPPPIEPWFGRAKGLALCLVVLWLVPRIGPRLERPGHGRGAIPAGGALVAPAEWGTASR